MTIQRTAAVVVTTVDTRTVATDKGIATVPVDIRLIDIAGILLIQTVGTTEDSLSAEGRAHRNVDDRTTGDTLLIATAIDRLEVSAQ